MAKRIKMDKRILVKAPVKIKDDYGGHSDKLTTYAERWARIRVVGGSDATTGEVLQSTVTYTVTMRYDPAIKAKMIIEVIDADQDENPQLFINAIINPDFSKVYTIAECSGYKDNSGGK